jgi:hypothetical protein
MTTIALVETTTQEEFNQAQACEIVELAVTDLDMVGGGGELTGLVV